MSREKRAVSRELKEKFGDVSPFRKKNQQIEVIKQKYKVKKEL